MRAVVVGAVEGTRVAVDAIGEAADWQLAGVVTLPPELARRHSDFVDLSAPATTRGAEVIHAANGNDPVVLAQIRELHPDILFVIGWSQLCKPAMLDIAPGGTIGYHPAPLPRLRGRAVIPWTILLDEPITAGTLFWVDEGTDTGPILTQRFFHVAPEETAASLYARHMEALRAMLDEILPQLAKNTAPREPQDERFATWAAKRTAEDGLVNWNRPAAEVLRLIRAVGRPYPGAFTTAGADRLILWAAAPWTDGKRHVGVPGQVLARGESWFAVACGDGAALRVNDYDGDHPKLHQRLGGSER